jgi:FKBP-type peptidyl-prolyl cis-trans isomerase
MNARTALHMPGWQALAMLLACSCTWPANGQSAVSTDREKISYAIGTDVGRNFHSLGVSVDMELLIQGLKDGMAGAQPRMSEVEMRERMAAFRTALLARENEMRSQAAIDNRKKGSEFAQLYAQREGVRELSDGILYRVLKEGSGPRPQASDYVHCNYRGHLVDGTEFDANDPAHPALFNLSSGVIPGWRKVLAAMPVGSRWEIMLPPEQAYGDRGAGRDIPPAATLVFEIELVAATPSAALPLPAAMEKKP